MIERPVSGRYFGTLTDRSWPGVPAQHIAENPPDANLANFAAFRNQGLTSIFVVHKLSLNSAIKA
jgi:dihydroorotate dehydrogenase